MTGRWQTIFLHAIIWTLIAGNFFNARTLIKTNETIGLLRQSIEMACVSRWRSANDP